jgi:hypothetical protein
MIRYVPGTRRRLLSSVLPGCLVGAAAVLAGFLIHSGSFYQSPAPQSPAAVLAYTVKVHDNFTQTEGSGTAIGHAVYSINNASHVHTIILTCDHVVDSNFKDDGAAYHIKNQVEGKGEKPKESAAPEPEPTPPPAVIKEQKLQPHFQVQYQGKWYMAKVIANDAKLDMALLDVDLSIPAAPIYEGPLHTGERELVAGAPMDDGVVLTEGFIGELAQADKAETPVTVQGSASAWTGNSGGGTYVFRDGEWRLAGVMEKIRARSIGPLAVQMIDTVSYFSLISDLSKLLKQSGLE